MQRREEIEGGDCGGVVVQAVQAMGGWGVIHQVGKAWQVWKGSQGLYPLRNLCDGGGVRGPTQRGISQGGDPTGFEVGSGWVEVALTGDQAMGWSHLNNTAKTEVGVVEDPPDQVRAVESGGSGGGTGG